MRILWTSNILFPDLAKALGFHGVATSGSWLFALAEALAHRDGITLGVVTPVAGAKDSKTEFRRIAHYVVPRGKIDSFLQPGAKFRKTLQAAIRDFQPDIIHVNGTENTTCNLVLDLADDIPVLIGIQGLASRCAIAFWGGLNLFEVLCHRTIHDWLHLNGMLEQRWRLARIGRYEEWSLRRACHVAGPTDWDRAHVRAINPHANYHRLDLMLREPFLRAHWNLTQAERFSILTPSAESPLKGFHGLLRAASFLKADFPDIRLRVPGNDPSASSRTSRFKSRGYEKYLMGLVKKLRLEEHVEFLGPLTAERMAAEMYRSHVFAVASSIENASTALSEAMSVGMPCISPFVGGLSSTARDGKEAIFYPSADPPALAESIRKIFENDSLAVELSENARCRARLRHDPCAIVEQIIAVYEKIVAGTIKTSDESPASELGNHESD